MSGSKGSEMAYLFGKRNVCIGQSPPSEPFLNIFQKECREGEGEEDED